MTTKKAAASAEKRAKAAKKQSGGKRRKLSPRQTSLIEGIVEGKSVRRAALDAGYSERMADHAGELLSTETMRAFVQKRFSLEKICQRIDEGMDAETSEVIILGRKGSETVQFNNAPNYTERRQSAALAARLMGADPASKVEIHGNVQTLVKVTFEDVAATAAP